MDARKKVLLKPLAENIASACVAYFLRNKSIDYTKKRYVSEKEDVGEFWYHIAEFVSDNQYGGRKKDELPTSDSEECGSFKS